MNRGTAMLSFIYFFPYYDDKLIEGLTNATLSVVITNFPIFERLMLSYFLTRLLAKIERNKVRLLLFIAMHN